MEGYSFVHRETVRLRDMDAFGHANNAAYLTYVEQARIAFLMDAGAITGLEDMAIILARSEIDYRSQLRFGDAVQIGVRVARVGTKSFDLEYELRSGDRVVAAARSVLVSYDYDREQTTEIPDKWRRSLAA